MNEFFDINRFFQLVRKETSERLHMMLKIAAIFSALLAGYWLSIIIFSSGDPGSVASSRASFIFFAAIFSMLIAPFNLYKSYNHRKGGIDYVLLPASVSEKYLSMLINCVILLPIITFVSVLAVDTIITTITPNIFNGYALSSLNLGDKFAKGYAEAIIMQLGFIYCNLLFRKYKVTKTLLSTIGLYIFFAMILVLLITVVFKEDFKLMEEMNVNIRIDKFSDFAKLDQSGEYSSLFKTLYYSSQVFFYGILPAWFIFGSYHRMKTLQY
ncbi:MAG: hypothetical protein PHV46_01805 [Bacteroidales bacterium]|jgi:hypothetical protein|nr:hypothetical protein [Bacteroidales bacterium]MDD4057277.1 hypothetical protein [Bacteroidales bacterium]